MSKKTFGVNNFVKKSTKKRKGRHSKRTNKNSKNFKRKRTRGQG